MTWIGDDIVAVPEMIVIGRRPTETKLSTEITAFCRKIVLFTGRSGVGEKWLHYSVLTTQ